MDKNSKIPARTYLFGTGGKEPNTRQNLRNKIQISKNLKSLIANHQGWCASQVGVCWRESAHTPFFWYFSCGLGLEKDDLVMAPSLLMIEPPRERTPAAVDGLDLYFITNDSHQIDVYPSHPPHLLVAIACSGTIRLHSPPPHQFYVHARLLRYSDCFGR